MAKITKQEIIEAIRRTAKENGGVPLGMRRFEQETAITRYDCQRYWATFGEAQREAGFEANTLQVPHEEEFIFESLTALIRELGRFPTRADLLVKRNRDDKFPNPTSINMRLGNKKEKAEKISDYATQKGYADIVEICKPIIENPWKDVDVDYADTGLVVGEVYLCKSGRHYKIGRTNDTVRRGTELRILLPEKVDLIHSIKTDDPSGVEAYWHRRFESKRMQGEWFNLSPVDVKAFKRWRRIF